MKKPSSKVKFLKRTNLKGQDTCTIGPGIGKRLQLPSSKLRKGADQASVFMKCGATES